MNKLSGIISFLAGGIIAILFGNFVIYSRAGYLILIAVLLGLVIFLAERNRRQEVLIKYITEEYRKLYKEKSTGGGADE